MGPDGRIGRDRQPGEEPVCKRCPKMIHGEELGDDRIMKAILMAGMGFEGSPEDSWTHVAVKTIRSFMELRARQEAERAAREKR